jgi:hypothetical protein
MAEPEVEAAWRAELERIGEKQRSHTPVSGNASKKQMALDWLGDEVETRRLRQEHTHHYLRWALFAAIGAAIAILIAEGLTLLR